MANEEQVKRLLKNVKRWNKWREENPNIEIDLKEAPLVRAELYQANLIMAHLDGANLLKADLAGANLFGAILVRANLVGANLMGANLMGTNLTGAYLLEAILSWADLRGADLREAYLQKANLSAAKLSRANLSKANLGLANLFATDLRETDLGEALLGFTLFVELDLSETKGLDKVRHENPSSIGTNTIQRSKGKIPEIFLRGCGLSDWEIESAKLYQPGLSSKETDDILYRIHNLRVNQAIQINPLFISYSHADNAFVDEMEKHLDAKGIRFWRDIHDATSGRLEKVVDRAIRQNPIVLLILSEHSVKSDWVEHEARTARELEKELRRDVLCPVALDDSWKDCKWPARLREQIMEYHILDFSKWKDEADFGKMFRKLVDGLDLFYKENNAEAK